MVLRKRVRSRGQLHLADRAGAARRCRRLRGDRIVDAGPRGISSGRSGPIGALLLAWLLLGLALPTAISRRNRRRECRRRRHGATPGWPAQLPTQYALPLVGLYGVLTVVGIAFQRRAGLVLTDTHAVVRGLRVRRFPWSAISGVGQQSVLGSDRLVLWTIDGRQHAKTVKPAFVLFQRARRWLEKSEPDQSCSEGPAQIARAGLQQVAIPRRVARSSLAAGGPPGASRDAWEPRLRPSAVSTGRVAADSASVLILLQSPTSVLRQEFVVDMR